MNMDEIKRLTTYLFDRCPKMDHHNLAIIRGDRKNPSLQGPNLQHYGELYEYIRRLWASRETGRYGSIVEPMLQWAKVQTVNRQTQVIPCLAGKLSAVVYANGDVSVCEIHKPLGNLRQKSFWEIWNSRKPRDCDSPSQGKTAIAPPKYLCGPVSCSNQPAGASDAGSQGMAEAAAFAGEPESKQYRKPNRQILR